MAVQLLDPDRLLKTPLIVVFLCVEKFIVPRYLLVFVYIPSVIRTALHLEGIYMYNG